MKISSNEVKIGLTVIGAILVGVLGFRIMRDVPLFRNSNTFVSNFPKVDGLTSGKNIFLNGVDIGTVKDIRLLSNDSVQVSLNVGLGLKVPVDSKAYIRSTDLLGSKAIVIKQGTSNHYLQNGDYIKGIYDEGMMGVFQEKGLSIGDKVAELSDKLNKLVGDANHLLVKNDTNLTSTLTNLKQTSDNVNKLIKNKNSDIAKSLGHLKNILGNADTISTNNKTRIDSLIERLNSSSIQLEKLSKQLTETSTQMNMLLKKINSGEGTLGKLVNDPSLYNNLDSLTFNLKTIVKHLDKYPQKYLKNVKISLF